MFFVPSWSSCGSHLPWIDRKCSRNTLATIWRLYGLKANVDWTSSGLDSGVKKRRTSQELLLQSSSLRLADPDIHTSIVPRPCPGRRPLLTPRTAEVVPGICPRRPSLTVGPMVSLRVRSSEAVYFWGMMAGGGAVMGVMKEEGSSGLRGFVIEWEDWMKLFHNHQVSRRIWICLIFL